MTTRGTSEPLVDFLPARTETLRESFQEKMRQKGGHRGRAGETRGEIRFESMAHGPHPEVDRLNDRFRPGSSKLKATLDVVGYSPSAEAIHPGALSHLLELFPRIRNHRCCGGNDIHSTLFRRRPRPGCALPPVNHGTDLCHLIEHLAIELVVSMSGVTTCSGVTCGHREPLHRFDLFIECEDGRVGAGALLCAADIVQHLVAGGEAPAGAPRYAETARYFLCRPRSTLTPGDVLAHLQGDPVHLKAALRFLAAIGFLTEEQFTFDFSGTILYRYRLAPEIPLLPISFSA